MSKYAEEFREVRAVIGVPAGTTRFVGVACRKYGGVFVGEFSSSSS